MAPSTPPPPRSDSLAALTIASTSSVVMSASITSIMLSSAPVPRHLLAHDAPHGVFHRLALRFHVLSQRLVDERLVVAAPGSVHARLEPAENVVVQPDR